MSKEVSIQLPWMDWTAVEEIGKNKTGKLYKAVRIKGDSQICSTVNVIPLPDAEEDNAYLLSDSEYEDAANDFVAVVRNVQSIPDKTNIVDYEDVVLTEREGVGYDIYLRTECLLPISDYFTVHQADSRTVAALGADIGNAIALCDANGIIHGDIKPSSVFVDDSGRFKLGNFGLEELRNHTGSRPDAGVTPAYLAPEVCVKGEEPSKDTDMYSLALIMYRLLNGNKLPFFTDDTSADPEEQKKAVTRRCRGEEFPVPSGGDGALHAIVMKALAFQPSDRYDSVKSFLQAIEKYREEVQSVSGEGEGMTGTASEGAAAVAAGKVEQNRPPAAEPTGSQTDCPDCTPSEKSDRLRGGQQDFNNDHSSTQSNLSETQYHSIQTQSVYQQQPFGQQQQPFGQQQGFGQQQPFGQQQGFGQQPYIDYQGMGNTNSSDSKKTVPDLYIVIGGIVAVVVILILTVCIIVLLNNDGSQDKDSDPTSSGYSYATKDRDNDEGRTSSNKTVEDDIDAQDTEEPDPSNIIPVKKATCSKHAANGKYGRKFGADMLVDGDAETCWMASGKTAGSGNWIKLDFGKERTVRGIEIINGNTWDGFYNGSYIDGYENLYEKNGRLRDFEIEFSDGSRYSGTASDVNESDFGTNIFYLGDSVKTTYVKLYVKSGYKGIKYSNNVCIGEFQAFS